MSKDIVVIEQGNQIIYENEDLRIVFSKCRHPLQNINYITMVGASKLQEHLGFKNVPVNIVWNEESFMNMVDRLKQMRT